jgi:outer membrane protein assembly factor BamB
MVDKGKEPVKLNKTDPDIIWMFDMIHDLPVQPQDASSGALLIHDGLVYAPTSNGVDRSHKNVPYPDAPSLIALDKLTGRLVAKDDEKIGRQLFHGQWSSPTLGKVAGKTLIIYGAGDGLCYAFEPAKGPAGDQEVAILRKVWQCDCNPHEYKFRDGKPMPYEKKHRPYGHKTIGGGPSEIIATPVFYKNRVYVTVGQDPRHGIGKGALTCFDATKTGDVTKTGKIWTSKLVDRSLSTVSIYAGLLYVADYTGQLHCLDAETGKLHWVHETRSPVWSSTLAADGKVYLGTYKRELWVLKAGREKKLLAKIRLPDNIANTPVAANGVLYVTTDRYLYALEARQ